MRAFAIVLLLALLAPNSARADMLGPAEPRTDCPRGTSSVEIGGGHGSFAACSPNLANESWPCTDGRRIEVVGLVVSSRHVGPTWDGRRGPMPAEMLSMGTDYVVIEGACEPPDDGPIAQTAATSPGALVGSTGALTRNALPLAGCQRVRVWISDPTFACERPEPPLVAPSPPTSAELPPPAAPEPSCGCAAGSSGDRRTLGVLGVVALGLLRMGRKELARNRRLTRHRT